jgi:formylglycine-generating enzyme required for sulfatase activity
LSLSDKDHLLQHVFRDLVVVNPTTGSATRQRAVLGAFNADELTLIRVLADARLLVTYDHTVEVAHEAVFRSWDRLKTWIAESQEDLILLRQVRTAAEEWAGKGQPDYLRWPAERLKPVYEMIQRQDPTLSEIEGDFIEPEQARLLREIEKPESDHERRRDIGDRLAVIGDTRRGLGVIEGIPDMKWLPVEVPKKPVTIKTSNNEIGPVIIAPFFVAQYQVTYAQFQAFVKADDRFEDERWWVDMPGNYKKQELANQRTKTANSPRDNVSWYQSVAFARWLDHRLQGLELVHPGSAMPFIVGQNAQVRLPTEWEWQWAAQAGAEARAYPWGDWQDGYANTSEAGLSRTIAVGMYPHGASDSGALDMVGNLLEWCLNKYEKPKEQMVDDSNDNRVLRGGSFNDVQYGAACACRYDASPHYGNLYFGLRVVVVPYQRL